MSFYPKYVGDITTFPCDVIINSLGIDTTDYGGVCGSILDASNNREELENIFKRANNIYDIGEFFFTDNYGLPVKSICHLITPHHDNDDKNSNILIYSIRNVLMACRKLNYKSIGIPLIGTGANKYDTNEVYEILIKICDSFCSFFKDMDVTVVIPKDEIASENNARLIRELNARGNDYHNSETIKKFKYSTKLFTNYYEYNDEKISFDKSFFLKLPVVFDSKSKTVFKNIKRIPEYIDEFIDAKFIGNAHKKAKKNVYAYLGYGKNDPISAGKNTFSKMKNVAEKENLFKICLAARMELDDAIEFLNYFGYCFSKDGVNIVDDLMKDLLLKRTYDIVEVNKRFNEKINRPLFK